MDGSWNSLIGDVVSGNADIAADFHFPKKEYLLSILFTFDKSYNASCQSAISYLPDVNREIFAALSFRSWILIFSMMLCTSGATI